MDKEEKKKYVKPEVTQIKIDSQTAVLAVCKANGVPVGPGVGVDCNPGGTSCGSPGCVL